MVKYNNLRFCHTGISNMSRLKAASLEIEMELGVHQTLSSVSTMHDVLVSSKNTCEEVELS